MSYRKKHVKTKIHRIRPKKSILKKSWFWILVLILLVISSFFYFLLFFPKFQVNNIIITGNQQVNTDDLKNFVFNAANTRLINFGILNLTTRSIFLVKLDRLNQEILEEFPLIGKVNISKSFPEGLVLGVIERKPMAAYCVDEDSGPRCFLIDENGILFEQLSADPENIAIVRQAFGENRVFVGEKALEKDIASIILKIQKNLKDNFQIDLREALITSPLRLDATTNENWQIYFNISENPSIDSQLIKLDLLLKGEITAEARKSLQYIDLRFKDRAFYK
ncbi:MAG: hypothetical protein ABIJ84_00420 [bacterium]